MNFRILYITLLFTSYSYSQIHHGYKLKNEIKEEYNINGPQMSAIYYSRIGLDSLAIESFSALRTQNNKAQNFNFDNYKLVSFFNYINKISDNYDVIVINEAHHKSYDREIIQEVLKILAKKNYKNYCLEAYFSPFDIKKIAYPLKKSGFYIEDPEFAETVRTSLNLNYSVFGYECASPIDCPTPDKREMCQSENLAEILLQNPYKTLIHCGYDHARIDSNLSENWGKKAMALRLKELFPDKKILTIDQVQFSDNINRNYNSAVYNKILDQYCIDEPSILINNDNKPFIDTLSTKKIFDIQIIQAPFNFNHNKNKFSYNLEHNKTGYIFIYKSEEFDNEKNQEDLIPLEINYVVNGRFNSKFKQLFEQEEFELFFEEEKPE